MTSDAAADGPPAARAPLLRLKGIGKRYATGAEPLKDVSFDIAPGAFVSLVGPSGCGKSTLLRLIAGLSEPTAGTLRRASDLGGPQATGFVFQDATLMPWASVFDNVYLPLKLRGESRAAVRPAIMENLARVGLADVATAYPRELSGGMRMRVSIARALVTKPLLLLMDEPFAALDEFTRERLDDELLSLWAEQRFTTLFVTHSVYESVYLSERILALGTGATGLLADIPNEAPYPRAADFRRSPAYLEGCRRVSDALRQGHGSGPDEGGAS